MKDPNQLRQALRDHIGNVSGSGLGSRISTCGAYHWRRHWLLLLLV